MSKETYGLSFNADGGCHWQFIVDSMDDGGATITTFSWLDGTDHSVERVSADYIRNSCILYASHAAFLERSNYWGDAFADRRNQRFIRPEAAP